MKRIILMLIVLAVACVGLVGSGCSAHDRYRGMTYRRCLDADALGFWDDVDNAAFLADHPTHLSSWYQR